MKRRSTYIIILLIAFLCCFRILPFAIAKTSSVNNITRISKVDLKRYFEKAMQLFEAGEYQEAIVIFENLIEIEKEQQEAYFTPFADIYIEKSKSRIKEKLVLEEKKWEKMKESVMSEAEMIAEQEVIAAEKQAKEKEKEFREAQIQKETRKEAEGLSPSNQKATGINHGMKGVGQGLAPADSAVKDAAAVQPLSFTKKKERDAYETEMLKKLEEAAIKKRQEELVQKTRVLREKEIALNMQDAEKKKEREKEIAAIFRTAVGYYRIGRYPEAIVDFKKVKQLDPAGRMVSKAENYIDKAQKRIKAEKEKELLAMMESAKQAKIAMEEDVMLQKINEEEEKKHSEIAMERKRIEKERMEKQKIRLKEIFEQRLKVKMARERVAKVENYMNTIRQYTRDNEFEEAKGLLVQGMLEFPENKKFEDILHYVHMQEMKVEEDALKKARELVEEKMLMDVAEKHMIPEEKFSKLQNKKEIVPLVKIPEIRKRLKIPINFDFKEVELDYVIEFLSGATGVNIVPSSEIDMGTKKVTMKIKDMPLEDALKYILKSQGLVYRIEEDAVWVCTQDEMKSEEIQTRVYLLNQGIGRFAEFSGSVSKEGENSSSAEVSTIKDILEKAVDWPKESKLTMDDRTGALIVNNSPSNLEIIENLLYSLDITPVQVLIEAKFLEIIVTDMDELGIDWQLNSAWGLKKNNAGDNLHGFASSSGVDFTSFSRGTEGFNLTYQGILSNPKFQMVMHALNEKQNVKTLSCPRITTLNNQTATMEVTDEYIYPTRYEVSLVQYDINGDGDFEDAGETEWANIPQDFVTRNVGILLHVKPSVGVDNKTITLALTPEVSETGSSFSYAGNVSIPQFKTRNLNTSVIVSSGDTVVLGGLIRETDTNIKTKVPVLGDLPLIGGLFRKSTDNTERKNLLIFVTATVMDTKENVVAKAPED